MGLFDNISLSSKTGQAVFVQQAAAFAKLDLNTIFKQGIAAVVTIISESVTWFNSIFGINDLCSDQDRVLMERMVDQIPGMILVMVKMGYADSSLLDMYKDHPDGADYTGSRDTKHFCNDLIWPARELFTCLFGVRIFNSKYLDALEEGVNAYFAVDNGDLTIDMHRDAVNRAAYLKQTFFPNWTYNRQLWDLNKFQEYPLVRPVPDPNVVGKLYTGNILGIDVVNGYVIGDPIPELPTSADQPFTIDDFHHDITYPGTTVQQPGGASTGSPFDGILSFVKANPMETAAVAGLAVLALYDDDK